MSSHNKVRATRWPATLLSVSSAVVLAAILACSGAIGELKAQSATAPHVKTVSIPVEGMSCVSCAARVNWTLTGIGGVQRVEVSLERRQAVVRFSPEQVTPEHLEAAINELGYKAGKSRVVESK